MSDGNGTLTEEPTREMPAVPPPGTTPRIVQPSAGGTAGASREMVGEPSQHGPALPTGLDRLRMAVEQVQTEVEEHLDLGIPGYGGTLGARYSVPDYTAMRDIEFKVITEPGAGSSRELHLFLDEIILCCECLLVPGADGEWEPLLDGQNLPVGWDVRVSNALDVPAEEAREVVLGVFAKKSSEKRAPYLVAQHHAEIREFVRAEGGELAEITPGK